MRAKLPYSHIRGSHNPVSGFAPHETLLAQVGVHIADVSHFVRHDSLLDLEARARGTTVYLVDRRFDMLPKLLAEDLCSLVGGQDRLAVSVVWHVDPSGPSIVGRPWFGRTVIHNRHQLSYPQVRAGDENCTGDGRCVLAESRTRLLARGSLETGISAGKFCLTLKLEGQGQSLIPLHLRCSSRLLSWPPKRTHERFSTRPLNPIRENVRL